MSGVILWYAIVSLFGLAAWPLAHRLLPALPDRGYTLSRALGLLLVGYGFWLFTSLGLLQNTVGAILLMLLILVGLSIWALLTQPDDSVLTWLRENRRLVVTGEALFAVAFFAWVIVRAFNPELNGTERPMELMFLNGIRGSEVFPPRDPWLSGYAISYYYFGYVISAMLMDLTSVATAIGFNIALSTIFALTLLGSYGLVYNLVASLPSEHDPAEPDEHGGAQPKHAPKPVISALIAPIMIGVMGNLVGFFQLVHALNPRFVPASFWAWLDIRDINVAPQAVRWPLETWGGGWWWRASRTINDRTLQGAVFTPEPIDEFPFFSFLLGDLHPHVLILPFVLLALGLAFNTLMQTEKLSRMQFGVWVIAIGGLAFFNTWDLPIYWFV
ncbi:MAG: hypothetical protein GYB68_10625, partial [Chloroflexi bacterium]|nr:hypothetical protein [Chloroflexota bacterium]